MSMIMGLTLVLAAMFLGFVALCYVFAFMCKIAGMIFDSVLGG